MVNFKEVLKETSLMGINRIIKTDYNCVRGIWIICLLILTSFCFFVLIKEIESYLNYEVIANIDIRRESSAQFPTITFCVFDPPDKPLSLNEILLLCYFNANPCNWTNFEPYINHDNTSCYRFNSGKNYFKNWVPILTTYKTDSFTGLNTIFQIKDYQKDVSGLLAPFKMNIFIQNYTSMFIGEKLYSIDSGLLVTSGITYIKVNRRFIYKLDQPFSDCIKQNTNSYVSYLFQYFIKNNKTYLQKDCFELCAEEIVKKICNCSDPLGFTENCIEDSKIFDCVKDYYAYYLTNEQFPLPNECLNMCPRECDSIIYDLDLSYLGMHQDNYLSQINASRNSTDWLHVNIYYPSLEYTIFKENPKSDPYDLFSKMGGILSLFLGISLISFVEIIEIFIQTIFILIKKYSSNKIHNLSGRIAWHKRIRK